jgi:hypothetical protein
VKHSKEWIGKCREKNESIFDLFYKPFLSTYLPSSKKRTIIEKEQIATATPNKMPSKFFIFSI